MNLIIPLLILVVELLFGSSEHEGPRESEVAPGAAALAAEAPVPAVAREPRALDPAR